VMARSGSAGASPVRRVGDHQEDRHRHQGSHDHEAQQCARGARAAAGPRCAGGPLS
jgi:hypothetical protein